MTCNELHPLLHAYTDGELDLMRCLDVEGHLNTCAACASAQRSLQALRSALRSSDLAYRAPAALRAKVRRAVFKSSGDRPSRVNGQWFWQWLAMAATAVAILTFILRPAGDSGLDRTLDDAVAGHVRSLMAGHLTDVASSDQHTVKPWFNGKLDFAPTVTDFASQGFPLVGGRLDYLDGHRVAALVYQHNKHFINVFIWPAQNRQGGKLEIVNRRGYSVINRDSDNLHYCAISDLNPKELGEFVSLLGQ